MTKASGYFVAIKYISFDDSFKYMNRSENWNLCKTFQLSSDPHLTSPYNIRILLTAYKNIGNDQQI